VEYDFDGESGSIYSLFSAPQFQVAMHLAGDGPGTHFMTQVGLLFKGEDFSCGESTMTEDFRADLENRLTRLGGALFEWSPSHAKLSLCPGHTVSIAQMHTGAAWLMHADGSPYKYYDAKITAYCCHDAYDGALGQTYKCKYAGSGSEAFAWSQVQEVAFHLPTLFTASGSYSAEAHCAVKPPNAAVGDPLSGAYAHYRRRDLVSREDEPATLTSAPKESHEALSLHPIGRYRKRAGRRNTEAQVAT